MPSTAIHRKPKAGGLEITVTFDSDAPNDFEILEGVDFLLSSIPRAANVKDGKAQKDAIIALWAVFRASQ